MTETITCGEATIRLLQRYAVTTVFGIPGVHTLDFCRGLDKGVRHVRARNEQGAGFMAEGWARATGKPGVALVISGPGVTNAATPLGQSYCDSLPLLLLSAEPPSASNGKGWGVLHEITEQKKVTEPLTAFSATASSPEDVPELMAKAFTVFSGGRPRPVHISIPINVLAQPVREEWRAVDPTPLPQADQASMKPVAEALLAAKMPAILVGGGAVDAGDDLTAIAETVDAVVMSSASGKGIVPDTHPLSLSAAISRSCVRQFLAKADVVLAVGTEISETDSFVDQLEFGGKLIRIDIDPAKIQDFYPADLGVVADAASAMVRLRECLEGGAVNRVGEAQNTVKTLRKEFLAQCTDSESQHISLLGMLADAAPSGTIWSGDVCQIVYTGGFAMPVEGPRRWFYPAGYCSLGNGLPNAIGAKMAKPDSPVAVLAGDGGFMFTMPELLTAADLNLPLPIIIWNNQGLKQISDDMEFRGIPRIGVDGLNPDFVALAKACHCYGCQPDSEKALKDDFKSAFLADRPTVIVVEEDSPWLN